MPADAVDLPPLRAPLLGAFLRKSTKKYNVIQIIVLRYYQTLTISAAKPIKSNPDVIKLAEQNTEESLICQFVNYVDLNKQYHADQITETKKFSSKSLPLSG